MDIFATCFLFVLHIGVLIYLFCEVKKRKKWKKFGVLVVQVEIGLAFVCYVISLIFNIIFGLGYYLNFLMSIDFWLYLITAIAFSCFLIAGYCYARWKVIISDDKIIKHGFFVKKTYRMSDISKIKQTLFGHSYYMSDKKLFTTNARYHEFQRTFVNYIEENSGCKIEQKVTKD